MPRNGQGVYSLPPVYEAVTGETIEAQQHNVPLEDLAADANNARPVSTGGTGAQSATQARENLDVYSKAESIQAIGEIAAKETPVDADSVVIVDSEDGNKPKKTLWTKVKALINTGSVGAAVAAANGKQNPADGDFFAGVEAGGSTMFKSTWANMKSALAVLFVLKSGDTMTGSLRINASGGGILLNKHANAPAGMGDAFITNDSAGNLTMWDGLNSRAMYQYNMINRQFLVNGGVYGNNIGLNGDTYGTAWGGWLSDNLNGRFNARMLKDGASYAGFASNDISLPYMRHESSGAVIYLARRDQVVARIAELEAGSWGSYAFLYFAGAGSVGPGAGVAGGQLRYSSAWGNSNTAAPGGSWRCMGFCDSNVQTSRTTLWLRYA